MEGALPAISRRSFCAALSAVLPIGIVVRRAHALSIDALSGTRSLARTLYYVGDTVLPSELGAAGVTRVVGAFQRWIAGYREHTELTHGYGTSRLRFTGPTPATRWSTQLDALDATAHRRFRRAFIELPFDRREALLREALASERLDRMPSVADANHVAVALLAFFYDTPEATDLCYGAKIGKQTCRPLAESPMHPIELRRRNASRLGSVGRMTNNPQSDSHPPAFGGHPTTRHSQPDASSH